MKKPLTTTVFLLISVFAISQSDSAAICFRDALREKEAGHRFESLHLLQQAAVYDSANPEIMRSLAESYYDLRKYSQARVSYMTLASMGNPPADVLDRIVQLSFNLKQYDDVFTYAEQLKKADPSRKLNYIIGKSHYDRDNYGEAIRYLDKAMADEPENGEIPYLIARAYADMMNYKKSTGYFEKAIALQPEQNNWYYELGLVCYAMHDDKNALKYIIAAGDKGYPKSSDYLENLGIAYLNVGNLDAGISIMKQILAMRPSDLNVLNMIAEAYYNAKKYNEAMDHWDKILEFDKENASALYMIGMCYQKKGEKAKGMALCDKAIEMDPSLSYLKQKKELTGL